MSRNTRQRRQTQTNMTSPLITDTNIGIKEAKEALSSPGLFKKTPEHIQEAWQELRRAYEASTSDSNDCQPFPIWALQQFEHKQIENIIRVGYSEDIGILKSYAPSARIYFRAEPWRFVLFFNSIEQGRARALDEIMKSRDRFTIKQLYGEVLRNRSRRIQGKANAKSEFQPADFRACCNESSNEDGNDAELVEGSDGEEGDEIVEEADEADGSEPEHVNWPPTENAGLDEQEFDDVVGRDAHISNNQGQEERDCPDVRSCSQNLLHSDITVQDETLAPDETNVASVTASQVANEARRRDTSPEQPSSPNVPSNNDNTSSIEEKFLRDGRYIVNKLEKLKKEGEVTEKNIKMINERISASKEQMLQVLQGTQEEFVSLLDPIYSDVLIQDGKRKMEEESKTATDRKKVRLVAKLKAKTNEFEVQLRTDMQRRDAAP